MTNTMQKSIVSCGVFSAVKTTKNGRVALIQLYKTTYSDSSVFYEEITTYPGGCGWEPDRREITDLTDYIYNQMAKYGEDFQIV